MLGRTGQWGLTAVVMLVVAASMCEVTANATATATASYPFMNTSLSWADRVSDLVGRLTLEEIMWQMSRGGEGDTGGPGPAIERLGIGKFRWDTECLRGVVGANATAFPQALGLAASFSPDLMFDVAEATAVEVRGNHNEAVKRGDIHHGTGLNCFSPVVNIMRDPRWGRNQETYGEDPYLSGIYAQHFIRGLQGNDSRYVRASGGCKHFDVHGGPENIPESRASFNAVVSEMDWRTTHLPAFKRCAEAGSFGFMCSYNSINGVPSCANKKLLNDITRGEWGWDGYVISDDAAIENIVTAHKYLNNSIDTVAACVNAGCNLELSNNLAVPYYYSMVDAVNQKKLTEDMVRKRVAPLFYTRMRLGEFDPPERNPYSKFSAADILSDEHKALAVKAAMQSFVLLKNSGVLPLSNTAGAYKSFGVVGPMADDPYMTFGDYRANPPQQDVTTPLDGLKAIAATVNFAKGCDDTNCHNYDAASVVKAVALQNDINFVVLGTGQPVEGEGHDRPDTELPGQQKMLLMDVIKHTPANTPIVLLLFNAGPLNISFADQDPRVVAIMECFLPAQATGEALRHVLLNDVEGAVPAGRLPFTWPLLASQIPPMVNYSMQGRTYRYYTSYEPPAVLYPFGYGLSYSSFEYSGDTHTAIVKAGTKLKGTFWIRNTGKYEAEEVSQVYISWRDHFDGQAVPKLQLAWFKRYPVPLNLPQGQQLAVQYEVEARSMAMWTPDGWVIKPGMMNLYIGGGQPHYNKNVIVDQFKIVGSAFLGKY